MMGSMCHQYALFTADQSRRLDQLTGIDGFILMQQAGASVYQAIISRWPYLKKHGTLHILCGAGNNAGDGYVVASCALTAGVKVNVIAVKSPAELKGDAMLAWRDFQEKGGEATLWFPEILDVPGKFAESDVVVDALLGTGLRGPVSEIYHAVILGINALSLPVVSVDIPSGLYADTGAIAGVAIQAVLTVTLISWKQGLFTAEGQQFCGEYLLADLNTSEDVYKQVPAATYLLYDDFFSGYLRQRMANTNKGSFGSLLIIGGEEGMGGAVMMAAETALHSGVGRVTVLTRQSHCAAFLIRCPEVMVYACESTSIEKLLVNKTAVVVGPGLGTTCWGKEVLSALGHSNIPILFDADALNLIAQDFSVLSCSSRHIFTPHPGEASRLLGTSIKKVQENRFSSVRQLQKKLGGVVLLKGSGTLIAVDEVCFVCNKGNSAMAIAGCGDILSGFIGGLLAQGYNSQISALLGVWLHALAGDEAVINLLGKTGLRATELIPLIRNQLNRSIAGLSPKSERVLS